MIMKIGEIAHFWSRESPIPHLPFNHIFVLLSLPDQFGFMSWRSSMKAIFLLRQLKEKYRETYKDFHMVFIDLEKAYNKIPRGVIWWVLEKKWVPLKYTKLIKDMYDRTSDRRNHKWVSYNLSLYQESTLSLYLFVLVMDELTKLIQEKVPWI